MPTLCSLIPDATNVVDLEPEELGGVLLLHLNGLRPGDQNLNRWNFFHSPSVTFSEYHASQHKALAQSFLEAWGWLERAGLIIRDIDRGSPDWYVVTRRGARMASLEDVGAYRHALLLPKELIHRDIVSSVWPPFIRGHYDSAVFDAFRQVEISVRQAAGLTDADYGVALMRKAFDKFTGRLRDKEAIESEREAVAHLFAGAIGLLKNPVSHRKVALNERGEAAEMILLASHLLRIVDARAEASS